MQYSSRFFSLLLLGSCWLTASACRPAAEELSQPARGPAGSIAEPLDEAQKSRPVGPKAGTSIEDESAAEGQGPASAPASVSPPDDRSRSSPLRPEVEPTRIRRRYVVAALGDSITDAHVGGGGYLDLLRRRCPESRFVNFGKGGDMTNQMLRRLQRDILPLVKTEGLTTLLVYGGVNDLYSDLTAGRTNERIEQTLSRIYQLAKSAGMEVVAVTVSPWGGFRRYFNERRGENTRLLNSWILGQEQGALVDRAVDSYALLSCGDPEALCPDYESRFHDGLHPGAEGQRVLGEKLASEAFADCR